uniref:Uncharacterized protein n=1 Tax=Arundo donax TaxID=35708 RepID=A0A0A9E294_ARUDO
MRPLEHEVDDNGNQIAIGDGMSLGGDKRVGESNGRIGQKGAFICRRIRNGDFHCC